MANKYFRAGVTNWDADASWSTTSGGAADTTKPTAADDTFLDANSANCTINAAAVCRSINCTGYTGTLTHNGTTTLTIGDSTAGASNIALKFVAGMTYTAVGLSSDIIFVSTSATVQTVDFASKTTGRVYFNATSNGSWQYTGAHNTSSSVTVTLTKGTLDINGQTCSWGLFVNNSGSTRTFTIGAGTNITMTGAAAWLTGTGGLTLTKNNGSDSTITFSGAGSSAQMGTSLDYGNVNVIASGSGSFSWTPGCPIIKNFTRTGTAVKTDSVNFNNTTLVCTGTLTLTGNSSVNRLLVNTATVGTSATVTAATWSVTNTDFQDITGAGAGSRDFSGQTDVGDCGGNTSITFPASVAQTWSGTSGGNWSTNAWTTRVPLPQDDVSLGVAFSASQTVTADMPRLGRSISWTGATGSPTWANSLTNSFYGSLTLISGMTQGANSLLQPSGRGSFTITSAGKTLPQLTFLAPSGTYSLQDALFSSNIITISNGSFVSNGFSVSGGRFAVSGSATRSVTLGSSTLTSTLTGSSTGNVFEFSGSNLTVTADQATFIVSTGTGTRNFAGGGYTFGTLTYTVAGSTGILDITGSNSFAQINFSDVTNARSLRFTAGTTTTIRNTNGFNVQGTSGKLMTIDTVSGSGVFTLTSTNRQVCSYLNVIRSTVDASPAWYAQTTSTNGGSNTNWIFTDAPATGGGAGTNARRGQNVMNLQNIKSF